MFCKGKRRMKRIYFRKCLCWSIPRHRAFPHFFLLPILTNHNRRLQMCPGILTASYYGRHAKFFLHTTRNKVKSTYNQNTAPLLNFGHLILLTTNYSPKHKTLQSWIFRQMCLRCRLELLFSYSKKQNIRELFFQMICNNRTFLHFDQHFYFNSRIKYELIHWYYVREPAMLALRDSGHRHWESRHRHWESSIIRLLWILNFQPNPVANFSALL